MDTTANRLKRAMEIRNMKAIDLHDKTGIGKSSISQYMNGKVKPKQDRIYLMAQALNVDELWLMGHDVPMERIERAESAPPPSQPYRAELTERDERHGVKIPVLGRVVAGIPIEAVQEYDDWEEIPEEMARRGEYFALRVTGDSMKPVICNGDVIIVRIQPDVDTEQIAVVGVNGNEATVKKIIKDPHRHGITLYGYNAEVYQPTFYSEEEIETLPVTIYGLVVEARHKFI